MDASAENHRFLATGDFRLRLHDVDRCQGADLHARPRVAQRLLRQVQRLTGHLQRVDGVDVVPVRVPHGPLRQRHGLPNVHVGDHPVGPRREQLLPDGVELEVAQQRLRDNHIQIAAQRRVEARKRVGGRLPSAVKRHHRLGAPREQLLNVRGEPEVVGRHRGVTARQEAAGRLVLALREDAGAELRRVVGQYLRGVQVLQLRVEPFDLNPEVLLEGQFHGLVHRQLPHRTFRLETFGRWRRGRRHLRGRLGRRRRGLSESRR